MAGSFSAIMKIEYIALLCASGMTIYVWAYFREVRRSLFWRLEWIKLEHDSAHKEGRKPRDIESIKEP